jgi:lipoprotein-anchoring transpeptidase ErfK/SrfK
MRGVGVRSYRAIIASVTICGVAIAVIVTGAARVSESTAVGESEIRAALLASVKFAPAPGATVVAPNAPIVVKAGRGHLVAVRVTSQARAVVRGTLAPAAHEWRSRGPLAYGTTYKVTATVSGASHVRAESTMTFRTLTPATAVSASVFPWEGLTVGIGQPIVFTLSRPIVTDAARARLLSHVLVGESKPIVGGWHWFSDRELHFRPRTFWPVGEHVTIAWDLTGWNPSVGVWGTSVGTTGFTVGDAHVSYADLSTDQMFVTDNGRAIATYPISGGKPTDPTMGGVHLVMDKSSVVHMVSSTNGIPVSSPDGYDELVYDDVHISDSGEYVHAAPWSVSSQGRTNVSHGCVNLSPADAAAFFAFSRVGDIVVVTGSPRPPELGDHGVMDWSTSWPVFTPAARSGSSAVSG